MDYFFKKDFTFKEKINFVFLCGSHFNKYDKTDKRSILKDKLKLSKQGYYPIILEENFCLKESTNKYLGYDDIFLNDLSDIEKLVSIFASKIFIIHDSYSTSAELGVFASNKNTRNKIAVLCAEELSIDEDKIGFFSKISFFKHQLPNKATKITFNPDMIVNKISRNKSDYYTYFHNNEIGENLWNKIATFLDNDNVQLNFLIKKKRFNLGEIKNSVEYFVYGRNYVDIGIKLEHLPVQICCILGNSNIKKELRNTHKLHEIVSIIQEEYFKVLFSTIRMLEFKDLNFDCKRVFCNYNDVRIREAIALCIYLLQASEFIDLVCIDCNDTSKRKIVIKENLRFFYEHNKNFLCEIKKSEFSGLKNE